MQRLGRVGRRSGVTRYHQVYTLLARALADGSIPSGSALPSESELMRRYQVGRNTVRRALEQLEREQRVVRRRGSGTYARDNESAQLPWKRLASLYVDLERFGAATRSRYLQFAWVDTPALLTRQAPDFGARCLKIERSRSFEGVCFSVATCHVAERVAGELTRRKLADRLVLTVLKDNGYVPVTATQSTTAVGADADIAKLLGITVGTPLLLTDALVHDAQGRPLLHQRCLCRADVYHVRMQVNYDSSGSGLRWQAFPLQNP